MTSDQREAAKTRVKHLMVEDRWTTGSSRMLDDLWGRIVDAVLDGAPSARQPMWQLAAERDEARAEVERLRAALDTIANGMTEWSCTTAWGAQTVAREALERASASTAQESSA